MPDLTTCTGCGNTLKLVTPIMGYCARCDSIRPVNASPPAPIHVNKPPPQPPPAHQETDDLGSEATCPDCGGTERKLTPVMAICQVCGGTRLLASAPARDLAKDESINRELITIKGQLGARGVPQDARAKIQARILELEKQLR